MSSSSKPSSRPGTSSGRGGGGGAKTQGEGAAGLPKCSFCSKFSEHVQVVCEGNCLICKVCQVLPATRKLVLSYSKKVFDVHLQVPIDAPYNASSNAELHSHNMSGICPLCYKNLARNMTHTIEDFKDMIRLDNDGFDYPAVFKELELGYEDNRLNMFYQYFQDYYINNGLGEIQFIENSDEVSKKLNSITHQAFMSFHLTDNSNGEFCDGLDSDDDNSAALIKKTPKTVKQKADSETAKSDAARLNSKKLSAPQQIIEKSRAIVDDKEKEEKGPPAQSGGRAALQEGLVNKQQPLVLKPLTVGKFCTFVANCFVHLWQLMQRQDYQSIGMVIIRVCTNKSSSQRTNDLRIRAAMEFMNSSMSNTNGLTALFSKIAGIQPRPLEYARSPVGPIAISIFALSYMWDSWYFNNRDSLFDPNFVKTSPAEFRKHLANFTVNKQVSLGQSIEIIKMLCDVQQSQWVMSSLTPSIGENKSKYPWEKDSISRLLHFIIRFAKQGHIKDDLHGSSSSVGSNQPHSPPTKGKVKRGMIDSQVHNDRYTSFGDFAKVLWKAEPEVQLFPDHQNHHVEALVIERLGTLNTKANNPKVKTFCTVDFGQALSLVDQSHHPIHVYDLACICISAWEEEHDMIMLNLNSSILACKRRPAMRESFKTDIALSKSDRLILSKLMKWYNSKGFSGIDWNDMKVRATKCEFTFTIPRSILEKPPNELEYYCIKIRESDEIRANQEMIEDLYDTDGPYAPIGWRLNTPGITRGNLTLSSSEIKQSKFFDGKVDNRPITMQDMEAIIRAEFLASQTLGSKVIEHSFQDQLSSPNRSMLSGTRDGSRGGSGGGGGSRRGNELVNISSAKQSFADILEVDNSQNLPSNGNNNITTNNSDLNCQNMDSFNDDNSADDNSSLGLTNMIIDQSRRDLLDIYNQTEVLGASKFQADEMYTQGGLNRDHLSPDPEFHPDIYTNQIYFRQRRASPGAKSGFIPSISNSAYVSPTPGKFQINLTDVMFGSSDVLANVNLLQVGGKMMKKSESTSNFTRKIKSRSSDKRASTGTSESRGGVVANLSEIAWKSAGNSGFDMNSSQSSVSSQSQSLNSNDRDYVDPNILSDKLDENRLFAAKSRLRNRLAHALEESGQFTDAGSQEFAKSLKLVAAAETFEAQQRSKSATGVMVKDVHVDIGNLLSNPKKGKNDLFMISEAMKHLSLYDMQMSDVDFSKILNVNLENGNITGLRVLELSGINLGIKLSKVLATKLSQKCDIVDLRIPNNSLGDPGLCRILDAIVAGGFNQQLLNLDASCNGITFSNVQMQSLGKFNNLQYLDLSRNNISINTVKSQTLFFNAINQFPNMESLSLAFNSIQDQAFELLVGTVEKSMVHLKVLDMERTFLSGKSIPSLHKLVNLKDPKMVAFLEREARELIGIIIFVSENAKDRSTFSRQIGLVDNLFTLDQKHELALICRKSNTNLIIDGPPIYLPDYNNYELNIQPLNAKTIKKRRPSFSFSEEKKEEINASSSSESQSLLDKSSQEDKFS